MKLLSLWIYGVLAAILLAGAPQAHADVTSALQTVCNNVDCLNNFTGKTGWSFIRQQEYTGGFTDLESTWYLSPGPGFDIPIGPGPSLGTPLIDINAIFKVGKLVSDKVPAVNKVVNSDPFLNGLLGALTIGESFDYDASAQNRGKFFDITWLGATAKWGNAATPPVAPAPDVPKTSKLNLIIPWTSST
jgi:hypothetical protein